ncbi:MAG: hypothetical protein KDD82_15655 [Planctomycetes bacterium]|nr:hypothetical protein [Planctomycetota bacterium]
MTHVRKYTRALGLVGALVVGLGCGCSSVDPAANEVYERGLGQAEEGNILAAVKTLSEGSEQYSGHMPMRFALGRLQFELGEAEHVRERQARRTAKRLIAAGQRKEALAAAREANSLRQKALPYYERARENLTTVADRGDSDRQRGWAYYVLIRVHVFFEDWEAANYAIDQAINLRKPPGALYAKWREFQAQIREEHLSGY